LRWNSGTDRQRARKIIEPIADSIKKIREKRTEIVREHADTIITPIKYYLTLSMLCFA
jgi:hypothetical protein